MESPQIEILGIIITEPFTLITDVIIALASLGFGHILYRSKSSDQHAKTWSLFFLFMGIAFMLGGLTHGLKAYLGINILYANRFAAGIAIYFAQFASIRLIKNARVRQFFNLLIIIELLVYMIFVFQDNTFTPVLINAILGLLIITASIQFYEYWQSRRKRHLIIGIGIASNIIPALIQILEISYNKWFNHNDINHLVMILCFYIIFTGARVNKSLQVSPLS